MSENREILRTSSLKNMVPARVGNQEAIDTYQATIAELEKRCGKDAASLFAEPARPSKPDPANPQITWFTPLDGALLDLSMIDEVARRPIIAQFRTRLQQLKPALQDPELGPVVSSWLNITSTADLIAVGNTPVLINWGYLPAEVARSGILREAHFAETVGRYATDLQRPPFTSDEAAAYGERVRSRPTPVPVFKPAVAPEVIPVAPPAVRRSALTGLLTPLIAATIAALIALFLWWPGVLIWPARDTASAQPHRDDDLAQLEERATALEGQARERVCRPPNGQLPALTPGPITPNADPKANPAQNGDATPPKPPTTPPLPGTAALPGAVVAMLANNVVLVIGTTAGGESKLGSGFFVTKDRIVTNRHVVLGLTPASLQVTSKALPKALSAQVVALSMPADQTATPSDPDFALLSVDAPPREALKLGPLAAKGTAVVASGFPFSAMKSDPDFLAFTNNGAAAPANVNLPGSVVERIDEYVVKSFRHSPPLGPGAAGGPVVDYCGRVVGINTDVRDETPPRPNQSLDVAELRTFLGANNVTPVSDETRKTCAPVSAQVQPAPSAAAPPGK